MANFPRTNGDLTKPIPTVLLLCQRAMYFCRFITNVRQISLPGVNYHTWGVRLRESVNKRKIQFSFPKVSASAYEGVSAYGNV